MTLASQSPRKNVIRRPSRWTRRVLAAAIAGVALVGPAVVTPGLAPELAPAVLAQNQAQQGGSQIPQDLLRAVEDYYHYAFIGRYDLAQRNAEQILQGNYDSQAVLDAFNEVNSRRSNRLLDEQLLRWQQTEAIGDVTSDLVALINEGRRNRAANPDFIREQIERLIVSQIGYQRGVQNLRMTGERAVPVMLDYLRNPQQRQYHGAIRQALRDLGLTALNPLLAATEMEDYDTLPAVLLVLGDLQYPEAVPYLLRIRESDAPGPVKQAAEEALADIGATGNASAADAYYDLADQFYDERTAIRPETRLNQANLWNWAGPQKGLVSTNVPPEIFNELMAMRSAAYALSLGTNQDDALSLWLASNYKREIELPEGATDPTLEPGAPDARFYGVQSGTRYLNNVLDRAIADRNAAVALGAIESLQEIIGTSNMNLSSAGDSPLTAALSYPDRRVRFEAAFALAQANPQDGFRGQQAVVPLLADALSQTGKPTVLLVAPSADQLNSLSEPLTNQGYTVVGATGDTQALQQAQALPGVDALVIDGDLDDRAVDNLLALAQNNPKLNGAAKLIMVNTSVSRYEQLAAQDPTVFTTQAQEAQALASDIEQARQESGGLVIDEQLALELATRGGELLKQIGRSNGGVYNLADAENIVLAAIDDARPEIAMLAGEIAALIQSQEAQQAIATAALNDEKPADVRASLFQSLAASAKRLGNQLETSQVEQIQQVIQGDLPLEVRAAAAEASGALDLPADLAKNLIIQKSEAAGE